MILKYLHNKTYYIIILSHLCLETLLYINMEKIIEKKEEILRTLSIINNTPMNEREPLPKISSTNNNKK